MTPSINVGLVGFGLSGRVFHAPLVAVTPGLRLTHVVERHGDQARNTYPDVVVARDLEELLGADGPDLIVVATPNDTHFSFAERALRAKKHVIVDKPFTTTVAEADTLIALAGRAGRLLSVYQNRRWDGDFRTVRQIVAEGVLGRPVRYEAHFDRYRPAVNATGWKERRSAGSGILYDLGSHLIDQALLLFGVPDAVTADIGVERENSAVDDTFDLALRYDGARGPRVRLHASKLAREPGPRFLLHGALGSFVKYGVDPQEEALASGRRPGQSSPWGVERSERWGLLHTGVDGQEVRRQVETLPGCYQAYYEDIRDAIVEGRAPAVTAHDGRRTVQTIELAIESARASCTIPWRGHAT